MLERSGPGNPGTLQGVLPFISQYRGLVNSEGRTFQRHLCFYFYSAKIRWSFEASSSYSGLFIAVPAFPSRAGLGGCMGSVQWPGGSVWGAAASQCKALYLWPLCEFIFAVELQSVLALSLRTRNLISLAKIPPQVLKAADHNISVFSLFHW